MSLRPHAELAAFSWHTYYKVHHSHNLRGCLLSSQFVSLQNLRANPSSLRLAEEFLRLFSFSEHRLL